MKMTCCYSERSLNKAVGLQYRTGTRSFTINVVIRKKICRCGAGEDGAKISRNRDGHCRKRSRRDGVGVPGLAALLGQGRNAPDAAVFSQCLNLIN